MVVPLRPGKFYGSSLPRPHIYTDVKFNSDRVDPPFPVTDPLLFWAHEAHWSMGGLSFQRLRLQGRIEGNANKLRKMREKEAKLQVGYSPKNLIALGNKRDGSDSPAPAPKVVKRRRFIDLMEEESEIEDEEEEHEVVQKVKKKKSARKLAGDFGKAATESVENKKGKSNDNGLRVRTSRSNSGDVVMKIVEETNKEISADKKGKSTEEKSGSRPVVSRARTSPRLAKQRLSH